MSQVPSDSEGESTRSAPADGGPANVDYVIRQGGPPLPENVGRFLTLGILGRGGGGVVYLADDPLLNRRVAVKVPKPGSVSGTSLLSEARAAAKLKHPNIIQIFDVGMLDHERMFVTMEYASGGSLATKLKRRSLNWQEAVGIVIQIASAISVAHEHKLVHRDLKPSNILLDDSGNAKVADFGLSMSVDDGLFASHEVMGTPAYMSPEQAAGHGDRLDTKSDLWSLGVILYEVLTGSKPFQAEDWRGLQSKILHEEPVAPRAIRSWIPRDVEAICLKCLKKKPDDRPASASEISSVLQAALGRRAAQRRRLIGLAAAALVGVAIYAVRVRSPESKIQPVLSTPENVGASPASSLSSPGERSLERLQLPFNPLSMKPEIWRFDASQPNSLLSIVPESSQFSVASPATSFFVWPVEMPESFVWTTTVDLSPDAVGIKFCWSIRPVVVEKGYRGYISDVLDVIQRGAARQLLPSVGVQDWFGGPPGAVTDANGGAYQQLQEVKARPNEPIEVRLKVRKRELSSIHINRTPIEFPAERPPHDAVSRAQLGLVILSGHVSVLASQIEAIVE